MNRRYTLIACFLIFILLASNPLMSGGQNSNRFSRSETLARQMRKMRFSSGVLPGDSIPVTLAQAEPAPLVPFQESLVSAMTRVNTDLLPPGPVAQPETQAEPYLAVNPENPSNLVAGYQESRFANGGARALNYSTSTDGGATWTEGILPNLTVAAGGQWEKASDPWVAFGPNNRAYFVSLLFNQTTPDNAIGVSRSSDGGRTWSAPVIVHRSTDDFNDKEAMVADTYPSSPHLGNVYVAWDKNIREGDEFVAQRLLVSRSTDGGLTWGNPRKVKKQGSNIGAIPRVGPDGTVYVVWAGGPIDEPGLSVFFSKSTNGGKKWSRPAELAEIRTAGVQGVRAGEFLPSFAVDPTSGDLYIAWADARWTGTDQATLIYSRDKGETWSAPQRVSDGPDDAACFTISVACNSRGEVAVSFYSLRNDPERRFWIDEYVTISRDRGATFEPARRATAESFDIRFAAQAGGFFLGDYVGLAAAGARFHLLWVSTHLPSRIAPDRRQPDVFTASAE
jgi:hypothetical protein